MDETRSETLGAIAERKAALAAQEVEIKALTARRAKLAATTGGIPRSDPPTKQGPGATRQGDGELVEAAFRSALFHRFPHDTLLSTIQVAFGISGLDEAAARALCARFGLDPETGEEVS